MIRVMLSDINLQYQEVLCCDIKNRVKQSVAQRDILATSCKIKR